MQSATPAVACRRTTGPWGTGAWPWILAMLALAVFGFWKPYFARLPHGDLFTHLHVALMLAWFALLLVQPLLILRGRRDLHRALGRSSYVLVPAIVATAVLLARQRIAAAPPEAFAFQAYVLFLGLATSVLFAVFWGLAIRHRHEAALHARYMVVTVLTLLDPVLARVMVFWARPPGIDDFQVVSYGIVYATLLLLIVLERRQARGRSAFPVALGLFALTHVLTVALASSPAWHAFARWFAAT